MSGRELVEVYRAKDSPEAHVLKSALEEVGIRAVVQGDSLQAALGEVPVGWSSAPRIMVQSHDVARAREIIAQGEGASAAAAAGSGEAQEADACLACGTPMTQDDEQCPACGWSYKEEAERGRDDGASD